MFYPTHLDFWLDHIDIDNGGFTCASNYYVVYDPFKYIVLGPYFIGNRY